MTQARQTLVSLSDTPYYHCMGRCVRQAFLCGKDEFSGRDFEHRRGWIVARMKQLSSVFSIDVAAFAVMSNHYHIVLRVDRESCMKLSLDEVIAKWKELFAGSPLVNQYCDGDKISKSKMRRVEKTVDEWRNRLHDISWFMRCLNEHIARLANAEDGVTGRFWEGRFKSQALLDEQAILTCMAYVDLNPVRAGIAELPEGSEFTSIYERIKLFKDGEVVDYGVDLSKAEELLLDKPDWLKPVVGAELMGFSNSYDSISGIPFRFDDYLSLVDWSGRQLVAGKRGSIAEDVPEILVRLQIDADEFVDYLRKKRRGFVDVIGTGQSIMELKERAGFGFVKGIGLARRMFGAGVQL